MLAYIVLFRLLQGASEVAAAIRIGPLTTQNVFRADTIVGDLKTGETLGIFKEPTDQGDLKP